MPQEVKLALGRIFLMGSRPEQPGDIADYERCRAIIMEASEQPVYQDRSPNYAADYQNANH